MKGLARLLLTSLLVSACGGGSTGGDGGRDGAPGGVDAGPPDATPAPDAIPTPFGCLGRPLPTTAPATVMVSGTTDELQGTTPAALGAVAVAAFAGNGANPIASTTSDGNGNYALSISTAGTPVDGYLRGRMNGYLDMYVSPPRPLAADTTGAAILMVTQSQLDFLAALSGVSQSSSKGFLVVIVADCLGNQLAGATVTVSPSSGTTVVYLSNGQPDSNATSTDASGTALVWNVATSGVTAGASAQGMTLRAHPVVTHADALTTTVVQP